MRGVSTKYNIFFFTMQTYEELINDIMLLWKPQFSITNNSCERSHAVEREILIFVISRGTPVLNDTIKVPAHTCCSIFCIVIRE